MTVDHATRSGCRAVDVDRIEEVVPSHLHGTFDAFIANHVIKHATDLVGLLEAAETLLAPGGVLAVPDERFLTGAIAGCPRGMLQSVHPPIAFDHVAYAVRNGGMGA